MARRDPNQLNELLLRYHPPLKAYLAAAFPQMEARADELLQDFMEDRMLKPGWLRRARRERGRFRNLLKASLKNFVRDRFRASQAEAAALSELNPDVPAEQRAEEAFGLEWARVILAEVLRRMELYCRKPRGKRRDRILIWETFRLRLLQPILEGAEPVGYAALVAKLNIASPAAAQNLLITARRIFSRQLNTVLAEFEQSDRAARIELQDLRRFLAGLARGNKA